ncbi:uncharacterized protein [Henckelia pumila]|uniref:uncharacterized protein isoform X2 n=1 Tax=Henckelia pumila TaxID=405737 RepID=UPI003C6DBA22
MGIDKKSSKGGNYVGGFLQMFDWNAKSRKKLFSSQSELPEQFKQKKRCDGNLPMTQLQMLDEYEVSAGASIKGGSDYSCASSVTDEDVYVTKAPGVVARLMGLDSMPKSSIPEPYSTPMFDSHSVRDSYYNTRNLESAQDPLQGVWSQNIMEPKYHKVIHRPMEKFQTEILPPKSAKSIPITHHKLLSPIKSVNFIPPKDAAQIMEAAARIIEPGPQASTKSKLSLVGSSSGPLRIRDLKEKAQATQKTSNLFQRSHESSELCTKKNLRGPLLNKSWDGLMDAEESTFIGRNRGKSVSLALQAKANVQKREGLNLNGRSVAGKEAIELNSNQLFKNQSITQSALKKPTAHNSSSVLRQNNQKQNCIVDKGKSPLKSGRKVVTVDSTSTGHRDSKNLIDTSKVSSRKWGSDFKDDKGEVLGSRSERVTRKKRSIDGHYQPERNQAAQSTRAHKNGKTIQSSAIIDKQTRWDQEDSRGNGTDIVSFTFTSPMTTRSGSGSERSMDIGENHKIFTSDSRSKKALLSSEGTSSSKFSFRGHNLKGSDALSALLEQKLKELTHAVEFSNLKAMAVGHDSVPSPDTESTVLQENTKGEMHTDNIFNGEGSSFFPADSQKFMTTGQMYQGGTQEETIDRCNSTSQTKISIDRRLPSPVSVLEHHSSCNSSDTASSNFSTACKKNSSSIYAQGNPGTYTLGTLLTIEGDAELSDSASSTVARTLAKSQETTFTMANCEKPMKWELAYIKDIICDIDQGFTDYALGRVRMVINPHLFDQMETQKRFLNGPGGPIPETNRRLLFHSVSECLELKCRQYIIGGSKQWIKGLSWVRRNERLAEEIYDDISCWIAIGDSLVDELVDKDMSSKHGRWLDFETEAFELGTQIQSRIINSLIDEVVADILVL